MKEEIDKFEEVDECGVCKKGDMVIGETPTYQCEHCGWQSVHLFCETCGRTLQASGHLCTETFRMWTRFLKGE